MTNEIYEIWSFETGDMANGKKYGVVTGLINARIKACAVAKKNPLCEIWIYTRENGRRRGVESVTYYRKEDHIGHKLPQKKQKELRNLAPGLYFKEEYQLNQKWKNINNYPHYRWCRISPTTGKRISPWSELFES